MHLPYQSFKKIIQKWIDTIFKVNKEHFTVHFIIKFNKQLSDFFNQESSYFESLLTQKFVTPF